MTGKLAPSVLSALVLLACEGEMGEDASSGFERWDSAGITITLSRDSTWTEETRWSVASEPSLVLGSVGGEDPHTTFGWISDVEVLSEGSIVVADGQANEIRVFTREGDYLRTLGGEGQGPGEFQDLTIIAALAGDSIVGGQFPPSNRQTIFALDGSGFRTVSGPPIIWNGLFPVHVYGWMTDGSAVVSHIVQPSECPPGTNLIRAEWHLFDPVGNHEALLGRLPSFYAHNAGEGGDRLAFSAEGRMQPDSSGIWHGFTESVELVHYTVGGVDRIVRTGYEPPPVSEALREATRAREIEDVRGRADALSPEARRRVEARVRERRYADRVPAYRRFLLSKGGDFWLADYPSIEELLAPVWSWSDIPGPSRWSVISPDWVWLGTVEVPAGIDLRVVTEDRIVGLRRDEWDVQYVVIHELIRPNGSGPR